MPPKHRILIVNNIATPYRTFLFDLIAELAAERGWEVEVAYMSRTERGRSEWEGGESGHLVCDWRILPGRTLTTSAASFHFNPSLVRDVMTGRYSTVVMAGGWHHPTVGLALVAPSRVRRLLWLEANPFAQRFNSEPLARLRSWLVQRADGFVIPNDVAREALSAQWGVRSDSTFVYLPNLVDPSVFALSAQARVCHRGEWRRRLKVMSGDRLLVWPARLVDARKGFSAVLPALSGVAVHLVFAGEGADRERVEGLARSLGMRCSFLGFLPPSELASLYAAADGILLGSIIDPNPLCVVEGLWAGVPIFVSSRCGNAREVVPQGRNGLVFDPHSAEDLRVLRESVARMTDTAVSEMGAESAKVARLAFEPEAAVTRFLDGLDRSVDLASSAERRLS